MDPLKTVNTWLEDMTYNSEYEFLEEGKDSEELTKIAKKRGITLPSHDLAIFKCKYAFTDRVNKNGCLLPHEEVAKSLTTLIGKAVDFDHFRKRICGTWIDAELKGDQIIAYGSFFKSNLQEDFNTIKELMSKGALTVSFEAWGKKKPLQGRAYSLNDICFSGGALLLKETPAFPGAGVLEMAKDRVLEFAKVMTKPESFLHTGDAAPREAWDFEITDDLMTNLASRLGIDFNVINKEQFKKGLEVEKEHGTKICEACNITKNDPFGAAQIALAHLKEVKDYYDKLEEVVEKEEDEEEEDSSKKPECARRWMHESNDIMRLVQEVDCAVCATKGDHDICHMDYLGSEAMTKCNVCGTMHKISFTPRAEVISGKRQIQEIQTSANLALHEDIVGFIDAYEGSDENLEAVIAKEFEGELEEAKYIKCMKCAAALDIHGNSSKCPKCGSRWEKSMTPELRPEERTDSPYSVVNKTNPDPQLSKKLSSEERKKISDDKFAVVVTTKNKKTGKPRKIRMFPIHDPAHVRNALARLPQAAETLKKMGISQETVKNKILKKARELKMDELMKLHKASTVEELIQAMAKAAGAKDGLGEEAIADVKAKIEKALVEQDTKAQTDLSPKISEFLMPHVTPLINYKKPEGDANATSLNKEGNDDPKANKATDPGLNTKEPYSKEYQNLQQQIKEMAAQLESATAELKKYKDAEEAKVKAETAAKVQARKDELGEFAKDMKDEDLLDETKFELAKLRKENAELKSGKKSDDPKPDLTKGSADKKINEEEVKKRSKIDELAFGRDGKNTEDK